MPQLNLTVHTGLKKDQNMRFVKIFFDWFSYTCVGKGQSQKYRTFID